MEVHATICHFFLEIGRSWYQKRVCRGFSQSLRHLGADFAGLIRRAEVNIKAISFLRRPCAESQLAKEVRR